jgi:hypothetical protein
MGCADETADERNRPASGRAEKATTGENGAHLPRSPDVAFPLPEAPRLLDHDLDPGGPELLREVVLLEEEGDRHEAGAVEPLRGEVEALVGSAEAPDGVLDEEDAPRPRRDRDGGGRGGAFARALGVSEVLGGHERLRVGSAESELPGRRRR